MAIITFGQSPPGLQSAACYYSPCTLSSSWIPSTAQPALPSSSPSSPLDSMPQGVPGKPLADIAGRPMVEHVYRRAVGRPPRRRGRSRHRRRPGRRRRRAIRRHREDDERLAPHRHGPNRRGGRQPVLRHRRKRARRRAAHRAGHDRPGVEPLVNDPAVDMTTAYCIVRDPADHANPNVVKVVVDRRGDALYFSRAAIPLPPRRPTDAAGASLQAHRALRLPAPVPPGLRHAPADTSRTLGIARTASRPRARASHSHGRNPTRFHRRGHARGSGPRPPPPAGGDGADIEDA